MCHEWQTHLLIFKVLSHSFHNNLEPLQPLTLKHFADVTADVTKVNEGSGLEGGNCLGQLGLGHTYRVDDIMLCRWYQSHKAHEVT